MQMMTFCKLLTLITISFLIPAFAKVAGAAEPTPVEVWCGGDDGLTMRLRDALEGGFRSSADFSLSRGKKPGTLVVTIPTHVDWKEMDKRTKVLYIVEFSTADKRKIGTIKGSCWDDRMENCAAQIVKKAKIAARKIGSVK